ncbi:MAG: acyl-CoA/acyl-ACP dehydrogenase [Chthonomonas sp.]|nr:acyl-CoA/acyl-ACP dehydrogenase [Chthonomonas sp.]
MTTTLEVARHVLREDIRPRAELIDQSTVDLREAFDTLGQHGLMALRAPASLGGPAWSDADFREFQLEVARASGTLAFLQTQQQRAVAMISKMAPPEVAERMLLGTSTNNRTIGIAFSQLRKDGQPALTATPDGDGYRVNGKMPWITGLGFFEHILIGATLPDGRTLFARTPFAPSANLSLSEPMQLAAMGTALTVSGVARDLPIPASEVVSIEAGDWIHQNDRLNVTLQATFALGCSRAAIDLLAKTEVENAFLSKWHELVELVNQQGLPMAEKLAIRATAIEFMGRAAHAALIASGGRGIALSHSAQRIAREAFVFSVSAITPDVQSAALRTIANNLNLAESPNTLNANKIRA